MPISHWSFTLKSWTSSKFIFSNKQFVKCIKVLGGELDGKDSSKICQDE